MRLIREGSTACARSGSGPRPEPGHGRSFRRGPPCRRVVLLLVSLAFLAAGCEHLFFRPSKSATACPGLETVGHRDVFFRTSDGVRLHGLLLVPKGMPRPGTILFLHGSAGNLPMQAEPAVWLAREGYRVFAVDYRGYGRSEGVPSIEGILEDARAALEVLPTLPEADPDRIVVFGQSLGGAVAVCTVAAAADRWRIRALIVDSAFAGYRRIARDMAKSYVVPWRLGLPVIYLLDDHESPERRIDRISPIPVVIMHGTADRVVPFHHGEVLYSKAKEPKDFWIVPGGEHVETLAAPDVRARFLGFLEDAFRDPSRITQGMAEGGKGASE